MREIKNAVFHKPTTDFDGSKTGHGTDLLKISNPLVYS